MSQGLHCCSVFLALFHTVLWSSSDFCVSHVIHVCVSLTEYVWYTRPDALAQQPLYSRSIFWYDRSRWTLPILSSHFSRARRWRALCQEVLVFDTLVRWWR